MSSNPRKILVKKKKPIYKKIIPVRVDNEFKTVEIDKDPNVDEATGYSGLVENSLDMDRHGYYLPPTTGRSIIVRKPRNNPLYVDNRIPLPPPLTEDQREGARMLLDKEREDEVEPNVTISSLKSRRQESKRIFEEYQADKTSQENNIQQRKTRKFISSLGKTGSASNFTFNISEPLKRIYKIKFISITLTYVVPIAPPTNAFIYLDAFPLFENPSYYETDLGTKYSAHFPLITGAVASTINMNYAFPRDYEMHLSTPSDTVNDFHIKLFKEDSVVVPGEIVDFNDVSYSTLEVEFYMENMII